MWKFWVPQGSIRRVREGLQSAKGHGVERMSESSMDTFIGAIHLKYALTCGFINIFAELETKDTYSKAEEKADRAQEGDGLRGHGGSRRQ